MVIPTGLRWLTLRIRPDKSALRLESNDQAGVEDGWRSARFRVLTR